MTRINYFDPTHKMRLNTPIYPTQVRYFRLMNHALKQTV